MLKSIKYFSLLIFIVFISILFFLFSYELYLNYENKNKFNGSVKLKRESSLKGNVSNITNDIQAIDSNISNSRVNFNTDNLDVEVWSRESYFNEFIRNREYHEAVLPTYKNLFDFFNVNEENLFIKKRNNNDNYADVFRYTLNTIPYNPKLKSILIVGDSFVAGQNTVNEDKIWHQIFADKIKDRYKDNFFNILSAGRNGWGFYEYLSNAENIYNFYKYNYLVIGFLPNDYMHFGVSGLYEKNFLNSKPDYINCINGGDIESEYLLKLYNFFPKVINKFILSFCDKYLFIDSNSNERFWQEDQLLIFKRALANLKKQSKANNFEVIFMPLNPPENSGIRKNDNLEAYNLIKDAGFAIIDDINSREVYKRDDISGWVNPADWHPSSELAHSYADDIYSYFIDRFSIPYVEGRVKQYKRYGNEFSLFNYFSYIRPFYFNYEVNDEFVRINNINLNHELYSSKEGYNKNLGDANYDFTDRVYPSQSALCAKINRPHIEIGLNDIMLSSNNIKVENIDDLNSIVVTTKDFTLKGEEIINDGYLLKPGEYINLVVTGSLIIANESEGCQLDREIKMDKFDIKVSII